MAEIWRCGADTGETGGRPTGGMKGQRPTAPAQALGLSFSITGPKPCFASQRATYADLIRGPDLCAGPTTSTRFGRLCLAAVGEHPETSRFDDPLHARAILQDCYAAFAVSCLCQHHFLRVVPSSCVCHPCGARERLPHSCASSQSRVPLAPQMHK